MNLELTEQEHNYLIQVLAQRPMAEALPVYLKLTGQQIVATGAPIQGSLPLKAVGSEKQ